MKSTCISLFSARHLFGRVGASKAFLRWEDFKYIFHLQKCNTFKKHLQNHKTEPNVPLFFLLKIHNR